MASNNTGKSTNQSIPKVIEVIRAHREVSRRIISKETGLSTPSITRLVNELMDAKILSIHESTTVDGAGPGRPASVVKLNPDFCCAIGVDVGEHTIQVALGDMGGKILHTLDLATAGDEGAEITLANITTGIKNIYDLYSAKFESDVPPLRAITIGVPGTVEPDTFRIVKAPKIKGWTDYNLKPNLESTFPGISIRVVNDINAAAIGESANGIAKGHDNFVFASVRRGIGAGIFIDGQLYQGNAGFAGEMGKMVFDSSFQFSAADGEGHLESICGEDPLLAEAVERGVPLQDTTSTGPRLRSLAMAAANGNAEAIAILKSFLDEFGLAIANIASLLDPSMIVVGGEISPVMDVVINSLNETLGRLIPSPPKVVGSILGDRAILQGTFYQAHKDACDRMTTSEAVT